MLKNIMLNLNLIFIIKYFLDVICRWKCTWSEEGSNLKRKIRFWFNLARKNLRRLRFTSSLVNIIYRWKQLTSLQK